MQLFKLNNVVVELIRFTSVLALRANTSSAFEANDDEESDEAGPGTISGPQLWNSLPLDVRQSRDNLMQFKTMRTFLFQQF